MLNFSALIVCSALIAAKYTPEQVKQAAMSETNAAFARYMGKAIDGRSPGGVSPERTGCFHQSGWTQEKQSNYLKSWWRRRESNPRPEIFHCTFYARIFCFEFRP